MGEISKDRLAVLREADSIVVEEIQNAGLYRETSQSFAVLLPVQSVGVMGDARTYENAIAIRSVDTNDFMTADWSRFTLRSPRENEFTNYQRSQRSESGLL